VKAPTISGEVQPRSPALDQRVGQREERERGGDEPGDVKPGHGRRGAALAAVPDAACAPRDSVMNRIEIASVITPRGTFNQEDPAPVELLADEPADRRAEREAERPDRPPRWPIAAVRSRASVNVAAMIASAAGMTKRRTEPLHGPRPRSGRHPLSARPAASEESVKMTRPARKHPAPARRRRLPAPPTSSSPPKHEQVAAYDPTQGPLTDRCRLCWMVGSATLTTLLSR